MPTAILYKLKLNQSVTTIPTVGFNVETVTYKNVKCVSPHFGLCAAGSLAVGPPALHRVVAADTLHLLPRQVQRLGPPRVHLLQHDSSSQVADLDPTPPCPQDVGGQDKIRPLWRHYYTGTQGLVFVVDSQDRDRIDEARVELHKILNDREMKDCLLLVFANKQDLPDGALAQNLAIRESRATRRHADCALSVRPRTAMTPTEVTEKLGLLRMKDRSWYCHPSNALDGEGLFEGESRELLWTPSTCPRDST